MQHLENLADNPNSALSVEIEQELATIPLGILVQMDNNLFQITVIPELGL